MKFILPIITLALGIAIGWQAHNPPHNQAQIANMPRANAGPPTTSTTTPTSHNKTSTVQDKALTLGEIRKIPSLPKRLEALEPYYTEWAAKDPTAAFQSANIDLIGEARIRSVMTVLEIWSQSDGRAAREAALTLDSDETTDALTHVYRNWSQTQPDAALATAMSATGPLASAERVAAVSAVAELTPAKARTVAYTKLSDEELEGVITNTSIEEPFVWMSEAVARNRAAGIETALAYAIETDLNQTVAFVRTTPPTLRKQLLQAMGGLLLDVDATQIDRIAGTLSYDEAQALRLIPTKL